MPDDWQEANIAPVFKKGENGRVSNYRPIHFTYIACKRLEHVIASSMMKHLEGNSILYDVQHGFWDSRLCETQLLFLYVDLASFCDCKVQTDLIIMNFAKAFDKASHRLLAQKLHHYGIGGHRYHNTSTSSHQWWKSLNDPLLKTANKPTDSACSAKWYTVWLPSPETNTSPQLTAAPEVMNRGSAPSAPSWLARGPCSFHERCLSWTCWTLALSRLLTSSNLNWPKNLFSNHHSPPPSFLSPHCL